MTLGTPRRTQGVRREQEGDKMVGEWCQNASEGKHARKEEGGHAEMGEGQETCRDISGGKCIMGGGAACHRTGATTGSAGDTNVCDHEFHHNDDFYHKSVTQSV